MFGATAEGDQREDPRVDRRVEPGGRSVDVAAKRAVQLTHDKSHARIKK